MTTTVDEDEFVKKQVKKSLAELRGAVTVYAPTKEERAFEHAHRRVAHAAEIARCNDLYKALAELNEALVPLGEPAVIVEAMDLVGLDWRSLGAHLSRLEGLVSERQAKLHERNEASAAADWQRFLAAETPLERVTREFADFRAEAREHIKRLEAHCEQLKRQLPAPELSQRHASRKQAVPIMPNMGAGILGNVPPPTPPQWTRSAAVRIGQGAPREPLPPMAGLGSGRRAQGEGDSSPDEFRNAIGGG
jgi:hypothetical protein